VARSIFLLSPAHCGGRRAQLLFREAAQFPLALRLRTSGATVGEVYSFLSGLYFRGKLAYARTFRAMARGGVLVIVPGWGLVAPSRRLNLAELREIAGIGVSPDDARFHGALDRDTRRLAGQLQDDDKAVLLGSIASDKYVGILERHLGDRLHFPADFVGRGDMSRGGLLLRSAANAQELRYVPIAGAIRRGPRPPRLEPVRRARR
jgi:hypothetical protein